MLVLQLDIDFKLTVDKLCQCDMSSDQWREKEKQYGAKHKPNKTDQEMEPSEYFGRKIRFHSADGEESTQ